MDSSPASSGLVAELRQETPIPLAAELKCAPGELLALVGPSGAGKTTVLRMLAGLARPQAGRIMCGGETWFDAAAAIHRSPQRRRVGLVFQDYALFPHVSAEGNVALALGHLAPHARAARARELLALVHLAGLEARRPAELSGGQRQRVALARALARDPAVLLLDEPFAAVDQMTRRKLQRELVGLRRRIDVPTVLVTHDLDEAAALADRMCVISRGRTLQDGPPSELLSRPRDALVARLLGLTNVFEGAVIAQAPEAGLTVLRWLDFDLECRHNAAFPVGTAVSWVVPASYVVMHRRDRPSRGERENPLPGIIGELAALGENTAVTLNVRGRADARLAFTVSTHVAERNTLVAGAPLTVSLLAGGIHLMAKTSAADDL